MIADMFHHWIMPGKEQQALDLYHENTRRMREVPGFISRTVLQSQSDPQKVTTVNIWRDEQARQTWLDSHSEVSDSYGKTMEIPRESDYFKKYGQGPSIQSKPAEAERWEVMSGP